MGESWGKSDFADGQFQLERSSTRISLKTQFSGSNPERVSPRALVAADLALLLPGPLIQAMRHDVGFGGTARYEYQLKYKYA